ncbi:methionine--tRNA ligase subunit beta [Candidatus Bathyarchaeota archaeon]|nr:MAG: methionine--tRNA ligase subunit beta [Candidatus Bathyarchaeota archaeon]
MPAEEVSIEEFAKLDLRVGKIIRAERIPGARKLLRLEVDLGEEEPRQLVAGIADFYEPEELVGLNIVVLANLKPKKFMGVESRGMLLAADVEGRPVLLTVIRDVPPGTRVR